MQVFTLWVKQSIPNPLSTIYLQQHSHCLNSTAFKKIGDNELGKPGDRIWL